MLCQKKQFNIRRHREINIWNRQDNSIYFLETKLSLCWLLPNRKDMFNGKKKAKAKLAWIMVHFRLIAVTLIR